MSVPRPEPAWRRHLTASRWAEDRRTDTEATGPLARGAKRYPRFERYDLSEIADGAVTGNRSDLVDARRSTRSFDRSSELSLSEFAAIVRSVCTERDRYPFASAGALYGVEVYLWPLRVTGLDAAVLFHLLKRERMLERLWSVPDLARTTFPTQAWIWDAPLACIVTADMEPYADRYGERGYRFALQEAGTVAHQLVAAADRVGLASCIVGGFADDVLARALELPPHDDEHPLACVVIGRER